MIMVGACAAKMAYTPPEAPAKYAQGSSTVEINRLKIPLGCIFNFTWLRIFTRDGCDERAGEHPGEVDGAHPEGAVNDLQRDTQQQLNFYFWKDHNLVKSKFDLHIFLPMMFEAM